MDQQKIIKELEEIYEILDEEVCEKGMELVGSLIEKIEPGNRQG